MTSVGDARSDPAWSRFAALTRQAVETQLRLSRDFADLTRTSVRGDADRTAAGRTYLAAVRDASQRYWTELAELGADFASEVVALNERTGHAVLRDVSDSLRGSGRGPARRASVTLTGALGSVATASVTVANPHATPRRVELRPGPLRPSGGGDAVTPAFEVSPPELELGPDEEQTVSLRLRLDKRHFVAGETYSGAVSVVGADEELDLRVEVDPA